MGYARGLAEDERLDGHRHRMRGHADAAEVDVVEIPQRDAVDHQHFAAQPEVLLEDRADGVPDVAVEDEIDRLSLLARARQRGFDGARKGREALVLRHAAPAKGERNLVLALGEVEGREMLADRPRNG